MLPLNPAIDDGAGRPLSAAEPNLAADLQSVMQLLRSYPAKPEGLTAEAIGAAAWNLGRSANRADTLASFCEQFLLAYKNWDYDPASNGEHWILRQLAQFGPSVIFDVGANAGDWLLAALAALPGSHVHAFEIIESTFDKLHRRVGGRTDVTANPFGLSDADGTLEMYISDISDELASYLADPGYEYRKLLCPVRRGDDYVREHGIDRIDFLKIDAEGAEHLVLKGFSRTLAAGKIDVIQFEYGRLSILSHFLLIDFYELLESHDYGIGKLYPDRVDFRTYKLEDEDFLGPNYIAVRLMRQDIIDALGPAGK